MQRGTLADERCMQCSRVAVQLGAVQGHTGRPQIVEQFQQPGEIQRGSQSLRAVTTDDANQKFKAEKDSALAGQQEVPGRNIDGENVRERGSAIVVWRDNEQR